MCGWYIYQKFILVVYIVNGVFYVLRLKVKYNYKFCNVCYNFSGYFILSWYMCKLFRFFFNLKFNL